MATIDVAKLAEYLEVPVSEDNPQQAIETVVTALKAKIANGDVVDERLKALTDRLDVLVTKQDETIALATATNKQAQHDGDVDGMREIQADLANAKAHDLPEYIPGMGDPYQAPPQDERTKNFHRFCDAMLLVSKLKGCSVAQLPRWQNTLARSEGLQNVVKSYGEGRAKSANDPLVMATSSHGADWVPTDWSGQLWEDLRVATVIANQFPQVNMTTPTFYSPYMTGLATVFLSSEATDLSEVHPTTGKTTLTAKSFATAMTFSSEFEEDSIIAVMPMVTRDLVTALAEGLEDAIINGDESTAPHMDAETTTTKTVFAWDGLRHDLLAQSLSTDLSTFATSTVLTGRCAMTKYGLDPKQLMFVVGWVGQKNIMAATEFLTVDKIGTQAAIITGSVGQYLGSPVFISGLMKDDALSATGYYSSSVSKSCMYLLNKNCWLLGVRRGIKMDSDRFIMGDYTAVVAKARWAWTDRIAVSSTYTYGHCFYNMDR